jgi:hypothetical protein
LSSLNALRAIHLWRDSILITSAILPASYVYPQNQLWFFWLFLFDYPPLLVYWGMRQEWEPTVHVWAAIMSFYLQFMVVIYMYYQPIANLMILLLVMCDLELIAIMKIGYDRFMKIVRAEGTDSQPI